MESNPNRSVHVTSFQFLNTSIPQVSISSQQTIIIQITNILSSIYTLLAEYYLPSTMILTLVNNSICLLVFIFNKEFYEKTSKNSRVYYILLALADIAANYSYGLSILGDGIYALTNGRVVM